MKKLLVLLMLVSVFCAAEDKAAPTWLLTVPTADTIPKDQMNLGIVHFDLGISNNIEAGLHGLKYSISYPDGGKLAFGASLLSGLYPYAVYTRNYDFGRLSLGVTIFPYFIFAGLETKLTDSINLLAEIHNGLSVGVRNRLAKDWIIDVGFGFSTYSYKNVFFIDYANTDYYSFKFPTNFSGFMVISLCYSFDISNKPFPAAKDADKPVMNEDTKDKPLDPIK